MSPRKVGGEEIGFEDLTPEEATKPVLGPQSPTVPQSYKVSAPRNISGKRVKSGTLPMHTRLTTLPWNWEGSGRWGPVFLQAHFPQQLMAFGFPGKQPSLLTTEGLSKKERDCLPLSFLVKSLNLTPPTPLRHTL